MTTRLYFSFGVTWSSPGERGWLKWIASHSPMSFRSGETWYRQYAITLLGVTVYALAARNQVCDFGARSRSAWGLKP